MDSATAKPDRTLVVMLSFIAALVIISLAVVFTQGEPEALDPSTPEGTVQAYARLVIDGDENAASEYLTEAAMADCEYFEQGMTGDIRLTLLNTNERADSADVEVSIITSSGNDPFGGSEWRSDEVFGLVEVGGDWKISSVPWQLQTCPDEVGT